MEPIGRTACHLDPDTCARINSPINDIGRSGDEGIWSRRITDEHRLAYEIAGDEIRIAACRYHYGR